MTNNISRDIGAHQSTRTITIRELLDVLFRRIWLFSIPVSLCIGLAFLIAMFSPKQYQSEMRLLVRSGRTDLVVSPSVNPGVPARAVEVTEEDVNTEMQLLSGEQVLSLVVQRYNLWQQVPGNNEKEKIAEATLKLGRNLRVVAIPKTKIIRVAYKSENRHAAPSVLTSLLEFYQQEHLRVHSLGTTQRFFTEQTARYAEELRRARVDFADYQERNEAVMLPKQKESVLVELEELESNLRSTTTALQEAKRRAQELADKLRGQESRVTTQIRSVPNQYSDERLNTLVIELRNKRTQLLQRFQPADRVVTEVDDQIRTTQAALERARAQDATERSTDLNPLHQSLQSELNKAQVDLAALESRQQTLHAQIRSIYARLTELNERTAGYEALLTRLREAETNHTTYSQRREEARIAEAMDRESITNVVVSQPPTEPQTPAWPSYTLNLSLGTAFGIATGLALVVAAELLRSSFLTPAEFERRTGIPVLATIPKGQTMPACVARSSTEH